ncbi:MAG TPA: hypothetical protein VLH75_12090 [Longimicrobiales bacterium]|nr:hypothetical protein [Longimicrobiales bacterium]
MRTTLNLDDDVLLAVKELAELRGATAGEVLSELARGALGANRAASGVRNGVPLLGPVAGEGIVTPEVVDRLRDDA